VGEGVARGGQHPNPDGASHLDKVPVSDRDQREADRIGGVGMVGGAGRAGERQTAGHVVIVDVGLEHVG
jgi:hypothetical protein